MEKLLKALIGIAFFVSFIAASWYVIHNTLYFHTDIARDFLLIQDIVVNKKPALIGPRSGGIPGVFHGPAWLYLNLPVFIASGGNPVAVGWFWVALTVLSVGVVYATTRKLTNMNMALLASSIYGLIIANNASNFINPFGAVLFSPLYLYFLVRYVQKHRIRDLVLALFTIGTIIQFQMAWGVPVLILSIPVILRIIWQKKTPLHTLSFGVLLIPLSTFILFDLRHQFLQISSVISYITKGDISRPSVFSGAILFSRIRDMFLSMFTYFSQGNILVSVALLFTFLILLVLFIKHKASKKWAFIYYVLYFYIGFWVVTLLFKGTIWDYYYWPFLPLFCIVISVLLNTVVSKKFTTITSCAILTLLIGVNVFQLTTHNDVFFEKNSGLWSFYKAQAEMIYKDAPAEFGWFDYSADQYGYSTKYAMDYVQKVFHNTKGYKFQKKPTTFLVIFPSTNKYTSEVWWKKNQVKINRNPDRVFKFIGGSYVEKYLLSKEEQQVASDPNMLQDLTFR